MAKDRNTFAKRQRELEKKEKASKKRQRRAQKKQTTVEPGDDGGPQSDLSPEERKVLSIFRQFMMSPGRMLCFSSADESTYQIPLTALAAKGLLVPEKFRGGYSLTENGFDAMRRSA